MIAGGVAPAPGLAVPPGDARLVALARGFLDTATEIEASCGAYRVFSDLGGERLATTLSACRALARALDAEYAARTGLWPSHPPAGTLVLFADRRRFREYVAADGELPTGYAGFSMPGSGLIALPAGDVDAHELARTLAHELAHLAHRRAFGRELPRWLSEGLADAVGDDATPHGFDPFEGSVGAAGVRRRLRAGYAAGRVGSIERLLRLDPASFDAELVSYDYDQSALFARFLLLDPDLAPRFRGYLRRFAERGASGSPPLPEEVERDLSDLDAAFRVWLEVPAPRR